MRIQHNIMAMNAYRNYSNNTSALSKNLERLSSGYKINRAGDDAAGLAISEKMRAQITGLDAAQKNVKDGISLVNTAEGAMQEIQDMLNRMVYLAQQSANGTYDNEVDRANLQKEVVALQDEINRIADSANFNGIKLLDGSLDPSTSAADAAKAAADAAQTKADAALAAVDSAKGKPVYNDAVTADVIKTEVMLQGDSFDSTDVGTKTILETVGGQPTIPQFSVSLNGVSHIIDDAAENTDGIELNINGGTLKITEKDIADFTGKGNGDVVTSEELAKVFEDKVANSNFEAAAAGGAGGVKFTVKADGENLVFTYDTDATNGNGPVTGPMNEHYDVELNSDVTGSAATATAGTYSVSVTAGVDGGNGTEANAATLTVTAKIGDETLTFTANGQKDLASANEIATAASGLTATNAKGETINLSDYFTVGVGGGNLTFTDKKTGAEGSGMSITGVTYTTTTTAGTGDTLATVGNTITPTAGKDAYTSGTTGYVNFGTEVVITGNAGQSDQLASTTLDLTDYLKDGTQITLGDTTYTIAVGTDSAFKDAENVVHLEDANASVGDIASKLSEVAKDNATFTVSHQGTDGQIGIKQKLEVKDSTDMTTRDKFAGFIGIKTVNEEETTKANDAAKADAAQNAADLQKTADGLKAKAEELAGKVGDPLQLQIGDTSDEFNRLSVSVGDMHVGAMFGLEREEDGTLKKDADGNTIKSGKTIADIDISTQKGAQDAVNVIKDAINYVSTVRGDLGAISNRLDHTSNNLSVMKENITDAESTIRDTDIAEEMMAYTKNNILVQSAQAMLAQANQVPQGVLQLLQ